MKKILTNVILVLVVFLGFQINAKAVYVSFNSTDTTDGSTKIGYMEGVSLRNGEMDLIIQDNDPNDGIDPNNMVMDGYEFAGWVEHEPTPNDNVLTIDNVNKKISFSANGDGNPRNVYATWTLVTYNINLDLGTNGESQNPENYTIESGDITLVAPTREGYVFAGWADDTGINLGTDYTIQAGSFGDVNLTALWDAITYDITYDLDGGEVESANPESYTADDEITLNNPEKEGYEFVGWTGTDLDEPTLEVIIPVGSIGDRQYVANFEEIIDEATTGIGTTDIDTTPVKFANPKTGDNIYMFITISLISGLGIVVNKKRLFN